MPVAEQHDALDGIESKMAKRWGPLPVGVWILAIAGGLGVAWYIRRRQAAAEAEAEAEPGRNTDTAPGIGGAAGGAGGAGGASGDGSSNSQRPLTNEEWYTAASKALLDTKLYNELAIDTALKAYLSGERQLTAGESAIVSHAIRLVGPPPAPTPSPPSGTGGTGQNPPPDDTEEDPPGRDPFPDDSSGQDDPRPTAPRAGSGDKTYTVASGDNLAKIAQRFYGTSNVDSNRNRIYRVNAAEIEWQARRRGRTDSSGGTYIYSGTRLVIPGPFPSSSSKSSSSKSSSSKSSSKAPKTSGKGYGTVSGDVDYGKVITITPASL